MSTVLRLRRHRSTRRFSFEGAGLAASLALLAAALGLAGTLGSCSSTSSTDPTSDEAVLTELAEPMIEVRRVYGARDETDRVVRTVQYRGETLRLGAPIAFRVAEAGEGMGPRGTPEIHFRLAEEDRDAFVEWSTSMVGERVAILVQGEVQIAPTINSPLPGSGVLGEGGDPADRARVLAYLQGRAPALRVE